MSILPSYREEEALHAQKINEQADTDAREDEQEQDEEILLHRSVDTEEDEQTDPRAREKTREERAVGERTVHIQFGQDDRCGAVGDEADQRGKQIADHGHIDDKRGKRLLAHRLNGEVQDETDEQDEQKNPRGVVGGGIEDVVVLTTAAVAGAKFLYLVLAMPLFVLTAEEEEVKENE